MAVLAGGLIGGWVGSMVGGGAALAIQIGYAAGSYLAGSLFAKKQRMKQPKMGDLRVQTAQYGVTIPMVHGQIRLAGNVIWASDKREYTWVTTEGGKEKGKGGAGKGGVEIERTKYYCDFAIALCVGPIKGVRRIWKDGKIVYDLRETSSAEAIRASSTGYWETIPISEQLLVTPVQGVVQQGNSYTVYNGSQLEADTTIEAAEGVAPSYNGIAYVVFKNFDLGEQGQFPALEFEVIR